MALTEIAIKSAKLKDKPKNGSWPPRFAILKRSFNLWM
jgi:hypothetical protein